MATFLEAQLGFIGETTYGTRVAPTRFLPFLKESLGLEIDYIESKSYRAGRKTKQLRRPGGQRVAGDIEMELAPQGLGLWLKHCLGSVTSTGAGPYVHTFTPGGLVGLSMTVQIVRTDQTGIARPFDYSGLKVQSWEMGAQVGEIATLKTTLYGTTEDTGQSIASASYPANWLPFTFVEGSLTVGGTATPVKSFSLKGDNGLLVDRYRLQASGANKSLEPQEASVRDYSGTLEADFTSLTAYNRFVNQTAAALVITLAQASGHQLVITSNVEFDGTTPKAEGIGSEIAQSLPFVGVSATGDSNVMTIAVTNADSAP